MGFSQTPKTKTYTLFSKKQNIKKNSLKFENTILAKKSFKAEKTFGFFFFSFLFCFPCAKHLSIKQKQQTYTHHIYISVFFSRSRNGVYY